MANFLRLSRSCRFLRRYLCSAPFLLCKPDYCLAQWQVSSNRLCRPTDKVFAGVATWIHAVVPKPSVDEVVLVKCCIGCRPGA